MPKQVTVKTRKQVFIVRRRQALITNLVIKKMERGARLLGHKQVLFKRVPVRIPVVLMAWYMDIFPAEKEFMVVLMKKSATKEWLVITLERINAFVITTVLCAADGVIITGQIAGWFICLNVLQPAIARRQDML